LSLKGAMMIGIFYQKVQHQRLGRRLVVRAYWKLIQRSLHLFTARAPVNKSCHQNHESIEKSITGIGAIEKKWWLHVLDNREQKGKIGAKRDWVEELWFEHCLCLRKLKRNKFEAPLTHWAIDALHLWGNDPQFALFKASQPRSW
jgi:hypothetical protein